MLQDVTDITSTPKGRNRPSLAEAYPSSGVPPLKLFDDNNEMVPNAAEIMEAWEAKCAADRERAHASYEAATREFLGTTAALSAIPSRVDQLRSRVPSFPTSLSGYQLSSSSGGTGSKTTEETLAEAQRIIELSQRQNAAVAAENPKIADLLDQRHAYR